MRDRPLTDFPRARRPRFERRRLAWSVLASLLAASLVGALAGQASPDAPADDPARLFQNYHVSPPYRDRVAARPGQVWPALPDVPEAPLAAPPGAGLKTVRVYYSDPLPTSSAYRDGGSFHAILLANLLGQYDNVRVVRADFAVPRRGRREQFADVLHRHGV